MDVIEEIYKNSIQQSKRIMRKDKAYIRTKNQVNQHYQFLCNNLSNREVIALNKLMLRCNTKTEIENTYCFEAGFKTGLAAVKELE